MSDDMRTPVAEDPAAPHAAVVSCWMCGIRLKPDQMVPDGAGACHDIRWYCQDTAACNGRWTSGGNRAAAARAAPESALTAPTTDMAKPAASGSAAPPVAPPH